MKLLTLVIASYNMECYLDRCLESISDPDIPDTLEVIIVNDGSKDRTSKIAHIYEKFRPENISVIEKENEHYGSCINKALEIATGKYFRPLDADDWINTESLISLLDKLSSCDADLVLTEFSIYKNSGIEKNVIPSNIEIDKIYKFNDFDVDNNKCTNLFAMHGMTYKTKILKDIGLKLHTGIHYTDTEYILLPLDHINNIIFYKLDLYQYNMMREGQSIQKSIQYHANDSFYILSHDLMRYYEKNASLNNTIIRSNQRCILRRVLYYFYVSTLVFGDLKDKNIKNQIHNLNKIIFDNEELKKDIYSFRYKGISFVKIWYKYHIQIFRLIPKFLRYNLNF